MAITSDYKIKIVKIGDIGEREAVECLKRRGHDVTYSQHQLDPHKDLIMDGKYNLEVKTQVLFYKDDCFTINETQYKKCMSVDGVIFIQVPHPSISSKTDGCIFAYDADYLHSAKLVEKKVWDATTGKHRKVYKVPRDTAKIIGNISQASFDRLKELTPTTYSQSIPPVLAQSPPVANSTIFAATNMSVCSAPIAGDMTIRVVPESLKDFVECRE